MIARHESDLAISNIDAAAWKSADQVCVSRYWNSVDAFPSRKFSAGLLWSDEFLYVRFETIGAETLVVSSSPNVAAKTIGLWERDVCEIFIAPDRDEPRRYFEFEIAPTCEWLDLAIDSTSGERTTDWDYASGMESAAKIEEYRVVMAMKIPWKAFGKKPEAGDVWLGNLFRCVGKEPDRGYLAWQPTLTETPNFHVPDKFGEFVFRK